MFHAGRFHLFNSRKHLNDRNCSLRPGDPAAEAPSHCMEWHTSPDGLAWTRRGVLTPPPSGVAMGQTKSARVYGDQLVIIADGGGQRAFVANASGLAGDDPAALSWSPGRSVQQQMNMSSFYGTENTCFSRHFILKTPSRLAKTAFYQGRLGTNIGKVEGKTRFCRLCAAYPPY
jgi:hypothetical protein|eukprot:COSAG02_NODE_183_length_30560_cov_8.912695_21_plen_174_part_00